MSKKTTTAIFNSPAEAAAAVAALEHRGFADKDISVLMSDAYGKDFKMETSSKLPEGAAIGAGTGGALGALIAGLTAVGSIVTGGAGLLVAGPLVAALAGAGAGSAAGGIIGGLVGYGITEHQAKLFAEGMEDGKALIAVQSEDGDRQDVAEEALKDVGGEQIARG